MLRIFSLVLSALLVLGSTGFAQAASAKGESKKAEAHESSKEKKGKKDKSSEKSKDKSESKSSKPKPDKSPKSEGKEKSESKGKSRDKAESKSSKSKGSKSEKSSKSEKASKSEGRKGKKGKGRHGKSAEPDVDSPGQASYLNYKVAPGDTLAKVAEAHSVPVESIASLNGDQDVKNLIPGKTLRVPKPQKTLKAEAAPAAPQPTGGKAGLSPAAQEAETLFDKGSDYGKKNDFVSAIATFDQAIKLNPTKGEYFSSRGHANYYLKKYDAAVADYTKAIEIDPKQALPYNMRGLSHVRQNRFEDALADFNQAIRINPKEVDFYKGRGYAYYNLKRTEDMCRDYAKACELGDCELLEKTKNDQLCK